MAKTVVKPCNTPDDLRHPKGEHLSRVAYDDNEPPKNYIWCKPDGSFWKWNGVRWMQVADFAEDCPHFPLMPPMPPKPCPGDKDHGCGCDSGYITREQLTNRLELFKADLFAQLVQYLEGAGGSGSVDIETLRAYFEEYIEPRIRALEENPSSYDDTELRNSIANIGNRVSSLTSRVGGLENTRVTHDELNAALSGIADSDTITNLTNNVTNLDNRVTYLENNPVIGGDFVTAEEVDDPSSIEL